MSRKLKVLIVGGVAGGASAAARLRRLNEHAEIILFEQGPHISYANCGLPYYIGDTIKSERKLYVQTPDGMKARFNIDVRVNSKVIAIDVKEKKVTVRDLLNGNIYEESYDKLILSPGAKPLIPPISGTDLPNVFTLRHVDDSKRIREIIDSGEVQKAVVIGGGFIGVEMAENFSRRGLKVTLVEGSDQILGPLDIEMAAIVQNHLHDKGVQIFLKRRVERIDKTPESEGSKLQITLDNGNTLTADLILLCIGIRPEVELAKRAGLTIGDRGGIWVNEFQQTSNPDVYAVGDAAETFYMGREDKTLLPLAGPANRQGRLAADHVGGRFKPFKGVVGTSILKAFDLTVASTGYNEKQLRKENVPYEKIYIHPLNHAGYYPDSSQMTLKLIFSPKTRRVLGAQIIGADGVDKRIDVISTALQLGATVDDLSQLELAYAPPYSSAKDPVNMAGFVACNVLDGESSILHWHDVPFLDPNEWIILDVRTRAEYEMGHLEGAVLMPLDQIRNDIGKLPNSKKFLLYCKVGLRGYYAERILKQRGFKHVYNLSGGYQLYSAVANKVTPQRLDLARTKEGFKDLSADGSEDVLV